MEGRGQGGARVLKAEDELWILLRGLDDPGHAEYPAGYNHRDVRGRFDLLAAALNAAFACQCFVDRHVEDASHHGHIDIPADACIAGEHLTVVVSNFGNLAVVAVGNPGEYSEEESKLLIDPADEARIQQALTGLGYVVLPEHPLWTRYDGNLQFLRDQNGSWWDRFFSYL
jgi:hypothetical protein